MAASNGAAKADRRRPAPRWRCRAAGVVATAAAVVVGALCLSAATIVAAEPPAWVPHGALASVQVIHDCDDTGGDVAVTRLDPPTIYVCPRVVALIRRKNPGAETFYLVHEYGHVALNTSDEAAVDCWAARELAPTAAGQRALAAVISLLRARPADDNARYGSPDARAERIRRCADEAR